MVFLILNIHSYSFTRNFVIVKHLPYLFLPYLTCGKRNLDDGNEFVWTRSFCSANLATGAVVI